MPDLTEQVAPANGPVPSTPMPNAPATKNAHPSDEELLQQGIKVVQEAVEADHQPKKFRIGDFIRSGGIKMPRATVDVFTDVQAGYDYDLAKNDLDVLQNAYSGSMTGAPDEELEPLVARVKELADRIWDTRLVFHLRGLAPELVTAVVRKGAAKDKEREVGPGVRSWSDVELFRLVCTAIEQPAEEAVDDEQLDFDGAEGLLSSLYMPECEKLLSMVSVLTLGVTLADRRSDAGFLGGDAESPGELGVAVPAADSGGTAEVTG